MNDRCALCACQTMRRVPYLEHGPIERNSPRASDRSLPLKEMTLCEECQFRLEGVKRRRARGEFKERGR
jgi:hypothetical protein